MRTADYYIDLVFDYEYSYEKWLLLEKEIKDWRKEASHDERIKFAESGAGEMLYMICSGIRLDQAENAP